MLFMEEKLKLIKEIILNVAKKHNIEIDKIILFGSRARGNYRKDSDWDLLIVTKKKLPKNEKWIFWEEIMKNLSYINIEIFITDKDSLEKYKDIPGTLERYSVIEGKVI